MPASISKLGAVFLGAIAGLLAVGILVLVPVWGVRKELNLVVVDWQELVLYSACLLTGTVGGARLAYREFARIVAESQEYAAFLRSDVVETSSARIDRITASTETSSARAETNLVEHSELVSPSDDELPLLTEPVFEESLSGGPRKAKRGFWTAKSKGRTNVLLVFLYLVLFVMCAVLCQKLGLGNIVSDPVSAEVIRTVGVGTAVIGLYMIIRGLFTRVDSRAEVRLVSAVSDESKVRGADLKSFPHGGEFPVSLIDDSEAYHAPHVPPTRAVFLLRHPICAGWLVTLTGLPLVFQAWFPLLAIPGLFIGMNWLFPDKLRS
ncbi:hypothetical protein KF707_21435 [Candidatus Obscuribacterales bacterium]|nr:hypothetical protein [Candidatus Obscuribacterales bacterium]MBX3148905.1 hypothetical protein [Candidatus Obscuribacterales bacterium]